MHLIGTLASGVNGAPSGYVEIYNRGTSTRARYTLTAEAVTSAGVSTVVSTGANVYLDANGGTTVYVNRAVDVRVYTAAGVLVREFTEMVASPLVEVRSDSFLGTDYVTGVVAGANPITLQAALDLLYASFGATNFNVSVGGSDVTIQNALGALAGIFYNVKDPTYGATGDGATDDTASIQGAINACETAGGGIVYFPQGDYVISASLSVPAEVNLMGSGANSSVIQPNTGDANFWGVYFDEASINNWQYMVGLAVKPILATNATSALVTIGDSGNANSAKVKVIDCYIGGALTTAACLVGNTVSGVYVEGCAIVGGGVNSHGLLLTGTVNWVSNCAIVLPAQCDLAAGSDGFCMFAGANISGCRIDNSACATGTYNDFWFEAATLIASVTGCTFTAAGGATVTAYDVETTINASDYFYEGGNIYLTDYIYGNNGTWASSATKQFYLTGRRGRAVLVTSNAAAPAIPGDCSQYTLVRTDNQDPAIALPSPWVECNPLTVVVDNSGNANNVSVTFTGAPTYPGAIVVGIADVRAWTFEAAIVGGALKWVMTSVTDDMVP